MKIAKDEIIVIAGVQGTGKTTLAKYLLQRITKPKIIIDPNGEYEKNLGEVIIPYGDISELLTKLVARGNLCVAIDEADMFFRQSHYPLSGIYHYFVHLGRHRNLLRIFITRRIADLHKDVVSQATHIISFYQFLPNDIDYLKKFMGSGALLTTKLQKHQFIIFEQGNGILGIYRLKPHKNMLSRII